MGRSRGVTVGVRGGGVIVAVACSARAGALGKGRGRDPMITGSMIGDVI